MEIQWDCRVTGFKGGTGGTDKGWEGELDQVHQKIRFDRQYLALALVRNFGLGGVGCRMSQPNQ